MASWTSVDDVLAGIVAGQLKHFTYSSATNVAGRFCNPALAVASRYGTMASPAARGSGGTLHVDSDSGYIPFTNAAGSNELRLAAMSWSCSSTSPQQLSLVDRVWSASGFSGTVATPQAVTGFPSLTRPDSNGTGLEMWVEIATQIGSSAVNITASYTNSAGTPGRTTVATTIGGTGLREINRLIPLYLQSGDTGVRSVESVTLSGTTGTAGAFNVLLVKPIALPMQGPIGGIMADWARLGLPKVDSDAALMPIVMSGTTSTGTVEGHFTLAEH